MFPYFLLEVKTPCIFYFSVLVVLAALNIVYFVEGSINVIYLTFEKNGYKNIY